MKKYKYGYYNCGDESFLVGGFDTPEEAIKNCVDESGYNEQEIADMGNTVFFRYEIGKFVPPSTPATILFQEK